MKMKFSSGGCLWSILKVVSLVVCFQGYVSGERAQGCVGSQLSLACPEMKVINITSVVLGDSNCYGTSCCFKDNDCTQNASANHTMDVHCRCDGQRNCTVQVIQERIPCGYFSRTNNDFERITYNCTEDPRYDTMNSAAEEMSTDSGKRTTESDGTTKSAVVQTTVHTFSHNDPVSVSSAILGVGIVGVVCLIITIGIVASIFVVKIRRKKRQQVKSIDEAKTVGRGTNIYEVTDINGAQSACPETAESLYCELDAVPTEGIARERIQCDSEFKRLYEPLVVYEPLE